MLWGAFKKFEHQLKIVNRGRVEKKQKIKQGSRDVRRVPIEKEGRSTSKLKEMFTRKKKSKGGKKV